MSEPTTAARPLTEEALAQVRAMLAVPNPGYDKNVSLLFGTARALLATLDEVRASAGLDVERLAELVNAAEAVTPFIRVGPGPLGDDPAAIAMRRLFDALAALKGQPR